MLLIKQSAISALWKFGLGMHQHELPFLLLNSTNLIDLAGIREIRSIWNCNDSLTDFQV
jgi:hypothetical protein